MCGHRWQVWAARQEDIDKHVYFLCGVLMRVSKVSTMVRRAKYIHFLFVHDGRKSVGFVVSEMAAARNIDYVCVSVPL